MSEVRIFQILHVFDQRKMLRFLALETLFSALLWIIFIQKLPYIGQTSVLYILKYHTLLGKINFRSSHFSNSACIWSTKNASISHFINLIFFALLNYWQTKTALFWLDFSSLYFKIPYIVGKDKFQKFAFFKYCMYLINEKCLDFQHYKPYFLRSFELFSNKNCLVLIRLEFSTFQNTIHCWESWISEVHIFQILHVFDQGKMPRFLAL